ncbi:hypothetical protein HRR99_18030 [Agrobacterium vaccinii]|uniref:P-loop ATPase, Sll1717 family n=1 Tax=Agrobacterium vaccinii TaxID=2735528 RepID=UPI001E2E6F44|nr:hypothetical protein [Agrobacterium vaccinii]UHS63473.1 hypothetical protein HRR99_18030 [Agrobacterium vaccinii]
MINGVVYRQGVHVGEISAEDDETFLAECFVVQDFYVQLLDMDSSKSIILGRTGSGKTAVLRQIERNRDDTIRIDPKEVAFDYISNSNIIRFVIELGCDVNLLFQLLWKHVFLSNSIRKYFKDRSSFETALDNLFDRNNPARQYFEKYQKTFWIEQDVVIKEISSGFEQQISAGLESALGAEKVAQIRASLTATQSVSGSEKREIQSRVKYAVSQLQLRDMNRAIDALNELMSNKQRHFYVLVDDLDLDWVDPALQYKLIQSLIETIKNFRKLRNVKILAALRSDVYEKSIASIESEGMQPEKYDGIITTIKWNKESLRVLLDKRISLMFKRQYSGKTNVKFYDLFPENIRSLPSFDYLCDRTLLRPRDLIVFINQILDKASGSTNISQKTVADVEADYSRKRLDALKTEWRSVHPKADSYISLLSRQTGKNDVRDLAARDRLLEVCLELAELEGSDKHKDECFEKASQYLKRENSRKLFELAACIVSVLYKIGAIELKLSKQETFYASYRNDAVVAPVQITDDASYRVTPMLWRALGITPNL